MLVLRERGSKTRQSIEAAARAKGLALVPTIEAEGREAVREIVATGGGVGVVSAAEFGQDPRLAPIRLSDSEVLMDERSEEHTSELQSLMRISSAVFCLKKKNKLHLSTNITTCNSLNNT